MQGRNGIDEFARFQNRLSFILLLVAIVFSILTAAFASRSLLTAAIVFRVLYFVFYGLGIVFMIWWCFRVFSRNVAKRQVENTRFLYRRQKIRRFFAGCRQAWKDRKTHRYFKCPNCGQRMRAPRHKGRIRVTCSQCSNIFITKT